MNNMYRLSDLATYSKTRVSIGSISAKNYVTTDNLLPNKQGLGEPVNLPPYTGNIPAFKANNILVSNIRPYLKKIWFADKCGGCSADVLAFDVNDHYEPRFVYYAMFQNKFFEHMMRGSKGTKMPRGDKNQIMDFPIPKFDKQTQQNIASVLSILDAKIELNNRINFELQAMAKLIYDYWFVQFDFPDANGKPYKSSGGKMVYDEILNSEIPDGWGCQHLATLTSLIQRGISPKYVDDGGVLVLNQKCIRDQNVSFNDARRHGVRLQENDKRLLNITDILVNSTGIGTLGRVAFIKRLPEREITVDSHVTIVRANKELILPEYLAWTMIRLQPLIESAANGSTGQVELSKPFLEKLKVVVPDSNILKKFHSLLNPIIKKLADHEEESEKIIKLRDWLLPLLMNGHVTVK